MIGSFCSLCLTFIVDIKIVSPFGMLKSVIYTFMMPIKTLSSERKMDVLRASYNNRARSFVCLIVAFYSLFQFSFFNRNLDVFPSLVLQAASCVPLT